MTGNDTRPAATLRALRTGGDAVSDEASRGGRLVTAGAAVAVPLWLLDVDGVINAVCGAVPPGYQRRKINGFVITWCPAVIDRMRQLHETSAVEIRWLTTWCGDAAAMIAPALGLPLDCLVEGVEDHRNTDNKTWWKAASAERLSDSDPARALIWTDDDLDVAERNGEVSWLRERTGPTLALSPDWRTGLTDEHLARIEAFVNRVNVS